MPAWILARIPAATAAVAVLGLGLGVRAAGAGAFAKYGGIALYAVFVYLLVVLVRPATRAPAAGLVALGTCWAIEFAQLTPWPAAMSAHGVLFRLALGTTFNPPDLGWYAAGIALAVVVRLGLSARSPAVSTKE